MDLEFFTHAVQSRRPVAIVLRPDDYNDLRRVLPDTPAGEWDKARMQYRGAPIVLSEFRSYIVEDTPDGPVFHMVG